MAKKTVSSRILKRLEELLNTKELTDAPFIKHRAEQGDDKLFLRKKKRLDYSNKYSEAVKEKIFSGMGFGRWSYEEHKNFILGIFKFGNKWKEIVNMIKTRNCIQARSHSQKFFFKLFKFTDAPALEHYVNLKNLFSFGKEIGEEKLEMLKEFLIKAYDQIENGENIDYFKSNLLVEFLKKLEKNKNLLCEENKDAADKLLFKEKRRLKLKKGSKAQNVYFEICKVKRLANTANCASYDKSSKHKVKIVFEKFFKIEKVLKEKAKAKINFDSYVNKTTNAQMTEESTNSFKVNKNKTSESLNLFEYNNFSFIQSLGNFLFF